MSGKREKKSVGKEPTESCGSWVIDPTCVNYMTRTIEVDWAR